MDVVKKTLIILLALGILGGLFIVGIAFFAFALIALPIIYVYQKYKMGNIGKAENVADADIVVNEPGTTVIDAEFVEVTEDKKND